MASIREQITGKIRDELVAGNFEAGRPLRETQMAKRFGVSRGPIRDAFLQLSQEGFLAYHSNRGVTVRHPPAAEDRSFVASLRSQIELHIIRNGFAGLTPECHNKIAVALEALHVACVAQDVIEVAKADMEFHRVILHQCGGEDFTQTWRQLCARMLLTYSRLASFEEAYAEHEEIFELIKQKELEKTLSAIERNITLAVDHPDFESDENSL
jgi:DNA-binding GntR family transcriptional regulator